MGDASPGRGRGVRRTQGLARQLTERGIRAKVLNATGGIPLP
ncbi:hypothetical protein FHS38_005714 [Streptomyces netropsis]|uniref:Uncharacterized protein n=1 Tax=Streptomyces netropsis TaxID=55404 RepID=A0A7W7PHU5_STRNE|nr:hypothetical protein [Streptomyces netropsis]MBB4889638.1 hypothetical protein [Streptomyces netropsis]